MNSKSLFCSRKLAFNTNLLALKDPGIKKIYFLLLRSILNISYVNPDLYIRPKQENKMAGKKICLSYFYTVFPKNFMKL